MRRIKRAFALYFLLPPRDKTQNPPTLNFITINDYVASFCKYVIKLISKPDIKNEIIIYI